MNKRYFGLHGSAHSWLLAELHQEAPRITVICKDRRTSEDLAADLEFFVRGTAVLHYPAWDTLPFEPVSPQTYISSERLRVLHTLGEQMPHIVITSADALMQRVLPAELISHCSFSVRCGDTVDREQLLLQHDSPWCALRR